MTMLENGVWNPSSGLGKMGLEVAEARYNTVKPKLIETALERHEGVLNVDGAFCVTTGKFTGRSPKDKHIVREPSSEKHIWWEGNNEISPAGFEALKRDLFTYLSDKTVEVADLECGAKNGTTLNIRLVAEFSWHALFLSTLLRCPETERLLSYEPEFTIINAPGFHADPGKHNCRSETAVAISFDQKIILICGTEYAGENKKAAFTILNHIYPERGILPMHCSANHARGDVNNVAIFFGLSGTGKTSLSADSSRDLIGDDEHGWASYGVFNLEDGCYAKTINLSQDQEPEIWQASRTYSTVLENVVLDTQTRQPDFDDASLTENTRAAYSLDVLSNASPHSRAGHPKNIFLLTCDAYGVTPPLARLTPEQAGAFFLLGFTSKIAGTERGVTSPTPTFSTCFGAPFLTRRPEVYAKLFEKRVSENNVNIWLVNTGWIGGSAGTVPRIPISVTRLLLEEAILGNFNNVTFTNDPVWGVEVPVQAPQAAQAYMMPKTAWEDEDAFESAAKDLKTQVNQAFKDIGLRNSLHI